MPRSRANLRTGGVVRTGREAGDSATVGDPALGAPALGAPALGVSALGIPALGEATLGTVPWGVRAALPAPRAFRFGRVPVSIVGPYPTRTELRSTGASASSARSKATRREPTATMVPGSTYSCEMVPANGDGNCTMAFAVSTSAIGWFSSTSSPTVTCHATSSDSVSPSPRSGIAKSVLIGPPSL